MYTIDILLVINVPFTPQLEIFDEEEELQPHPDEDDFY